jgi:membrane protein implicated in regulation of membrane protease activity
MTLGVGPEGDARDRVPPTDKGKLVVAGILLLIPLVALMWVSSYARETPRLGGIPFFFWYQFLWVIICSLLTYSAYRLVLAARHQQPPREDEWSEPEVRR